jgi:hypothetical protein
MVGQEIQPLKGEMELGGGLCFLAMSDGGTKKMKRRNYSERNIRSFLSSFFMPQKNLY